MSTVVNGVTPAVLEHAGVVTDGDQYIDSTATTDIALLDSLPREQQELAVSMMLDQSKQWLDRAMEATNPARVVSEFKAFVATVAEASKQKKLSEGIQLDAVEMVRRAERALGVAIRKGQAAGEIRSADSANRARAIQREAAKRGEHRSLDETPVLASPQEFIRYSQERADTYSMTDNVSDEQFDAVIESAKAEGNLSRANVVKKIKAQPEPRPATDPSGKTDYHHTLAALHPTARIAFEADGHKEHKNLEAFWSAARRAGVKWRFTEKQWQKRVATSTDVLDRSTLGIEVALAAIEERVDMTTITPQQATEALERLNSSAFNKIIRQLKEISNG